MRYFIDCEFDGYKGPLISMALVREDGRSLHFYDPEAEASAKDPWVVENVLPILKACPEPPTPRSRLSAAHAVEDFLSDDPAPVIIADWPDDIRHLCELLVIDAGAMIRSGTLRFEVRRVDAYPTHLAGAVQHNAFWDALALCERVLLDDGEEERAPAGREAGVYRPGDIVALRGGGCPLTVTDYLDAFGDRPANVSVAWMTDDGEMLHAALPAPALVRMAG